MTLGHSMGGFAALAMPRFTPVKVALGLSPQVSVHPEVVDYYLQHLVGVPASHARNSSA